MFPQKNNPSFISLLFIALIVRLISQAGKPFWLDEAISWSFAKQNISPMLLATAADNHPPLYYLFLHFWLKFGQSEIFLRFPSIIFGLVSLIFIYKIAQKLFDQKIAFTSALIFSLSPLHVYFSSETRMYNLWIMLSLISFYYFLRIIRNPKAIYYLLFTIFNTLSLYAHYFSFLSLVSLDLLLIFRLCRYRKQLPNILLSQVISGFLFLPWFLFILHNPHPQPWEIPLLIAIPATYLSFVLGGLGATTLKTFFASSTPLTIKGFFLVVSLYFLVFAILGFLKKTKEETKRILLFLLIFPLLLTVFISLFKPLYSPRSFIIFSPVFYLLVALGLEKMKNPLRWWLKFTTVALLGITLLLQNFYPPFKPQTLKQAAEFIKKQSSVPPTIVHTDILTFYPFKYYLRDLQVNQFLIFPSGLSEVTTDIIEGSPINLSQILKQGQPFWSVTYTWDEKTWSFKTEQSKLNDKFSYNSARTINDLEIFYHYPRQSTSSPLPR